MIDTDPSSTKTLTPTSWNLPLTTALTPNSLLTRSFVASVAINLLLISPALLFLLCLLQRLGALFVSPLLTSSPVDWHA